MAVFLVLANNRFLVQKTRFGMTTSFGNPNLPVSNRELWGGL